MTTLGRILIIEGWSDEAFALLIQQIRDGLLNRHDLELLEDTACEAKVNRRERWLTPDHTHPSPPLGHDDSDDCVCGPLS